MTDVVSTVANCAGLKVHYRSAGTPENPPVVLLHGGGFDSAGLSWKHTIPALADDFRVIAPDLPGYGGSDPPDASVSMEYYVSVLGRFLDAVAIDTTALIGISMGGGIALGFALDDPDRVSKLVLVDSYGLGGTVPGGPLGYAFTRLGLTGLTFSLLSRSRTMTALALRSVIEGKPDDVLVSEAFAGLRRHDGTTWDAFQKNEVGPWGLRTNYIGRLPDLAVPTLVVHGEHDPIVPVSWAVRAGTLIPDVKARLIPNCGHMPPREKPTEFNELVREFC
ncbi:alpha/beta fold hydrolase [Haladaptatus caseinilyticus]|uniref:alpha/beta fold hydrolase n=1 Tax=Haladaptatus caseinilyticus TaxID=2993314 RepID=UPI00224A7F2B|nr:alpha/beta hydrolase [Haladaptatus caseinilyticus]